MFSTSPALLVVLYITLHWEFSAGPGRVRVITGFKSSCNHVNKGEELHWACVQSLRDYYYYYAAIKYITEHGCFLSPYQLSPRCLCSHLNPLLSTKRCSQTRSPIKGLHQPFVSHSNCQSVHLIKYFSGSGQKRRRKSTKDLLLGLPRKSSTLKTEKI